MSARGRGRKTERQSQPKLRAALSVDAVAKWVLSGEGQAAMKKARVASDQSVAALAQSRQVDPAVLREPITF